MSHNLSPLMTVMVGAAKKAGKHLRRDFGEVEHLQVSQKGPADFVSTSDKKAEKILFEELEKARPDFGFILEEGGEHPAKKHSNTYWVVDPLDGTTNFLHGIDQFAISLAVLKDDEIIAGLIYEPISDGFYWAEKGQGAFYNNKRLRVSNRKHLHETIIGTGMPWKGRASGKEELVYLKQLHRVLRKTAGIRRMGAAALDLAYVAAGKFDGFWETHLNIWDCAAGIILVKEAGGYVSDINGQACDPFSGRIVAANPLIHSALIELVHV